MAATFRDFFQRPRRYQFNKAAVAVIPQGNDITTSHTRIEWEREVVLSVARSIEPDATKVMTWFSSDSIDELGGKTAQQLVWDGATAQLLDMLVSIRSGRRDR